MEQIIIPIWGQNEQVWFLLPAKKYSKDQYIQLKIHISEQNLKANYKNSAVIQEWV